MKKIFFAASTYAAPELLDDYLGIIKELKRNGTHIILDWTKDWKTIAKQYRNKGISEISESDVVKVIDFKNMYSEHLDAIKDCDFVVAEVTRPTISVGYQIFHSISNKKPVLALYNESIESDLAKIKKMINATSPLVTLKKYNEKSLPGLIKRFIKKEKFSLKKFNFLISQEVERYLGWLQQRNKDHSKSELLRDKIAEEIIYKDGEYQKYLQKR